MNKLLSIDQSCDGRKNVQMWHLGRAQETLLFANLSTTCAKRLLFFQPPKITRIDDENGPKKTTR